MFEVTNPKQMKSKRIDRIRAGRSWRVSSKSVLLFECPYLRTETLTRNCRSDFSSQMPLDTELCRFKQLFASI